MDHPVEDRKNRKYQGVSMTCDRCGEEIFWEALRKAEAEALGVPGLPGYWYCCRCGTRDMRPPEARYPDSDIFYTSSISAIMGLAPDTLRRLHKTDPSLSFMHEEGGQLITHSNSGTAWKDWYDEKKATDRRAKKENYEPYLVRWVVDGKRKA